MNVLSLTYYSCPMHRHFTATAFVIDSKQRVLLLWHRRLQRWMPPGGHVDEDETPEDAAKRECKEETNLDVEIIGDEQDDLFRNNPDEGRMLKKPIALLLENIPACPERSEGAHQHMDFLYLARPLNAVAADFNRRESDDMRWFTKEEVEKLDERTEIFANVKSYILATLSK